VFAGAYQAARSLIDIDERIGLLLLSERTGRRCEHRRRFRLRNDFRMPEPSKQFELARCQPADSLLG
jgi:hypothetical protein